MLTEDMARNPMALVQANPRPSAPGIVRPTVGGMTPDDPEYQRKIPPPAPMSAIELAAIEEEKRRQEATVSGSAQGPAAVGVTTPGAASPPTYRLLVTCSRVEGALVVGLECAPDWDVAETWTMTQESARCVAKVARALGVKIKDMSGGELGVPDVRVPVDAGSTVPDSDLGRARDGASHLSHMRGAGTDHARESVGRTDPNGAAGVIPVAPGSTGDLEFLETARRQYEEELALKAREASPGGDPPAGEASDDREDALRRRLGLPPSPSVLGGVRGVPWNPDEPPGGPDPVAPGEATAQPE